MKILHLVRHAKSAWDDADIPDHDRPLAPRGVRAAPRMGRHLAKAFPPPDLVLCSTARRAAETTGLIVAQLKGAPPVVHEAGLYLPGAAALLRRLRQVDDGAASILLVGHNPDIHELAVSLAGSGAAAELTALRARFPTAALATLSFPIGRWRDLGAGAGELVGYTVPRRPA